MGIFTRVRDIISSNINSMLDKAEHPEKLVRMMIQEMEDTLVEIKANCAGAMATRKNIQRQLDVVRERARQWDEKAQLALNKGREDLTREALFEKRRYTERTGSYESEMTQAETLIEQYQTDIVELEKKLAAAREKQRILVQRHIHATTKQRAQNDIRKLDTSDAFLRFEKFESRIDRMEADAELVNMGRKSTLEDEISRLAEDEGIEQELRQMKDKQK
jgi:phage shock protein A